MVLELLDTMETTSTLMPKFLLPPQTTLVLLCASMSETPIPEGSLQAPRSRISKLGPAQTPHS